MIRRVNPEQIQRIIARYRAMLEKANGSAVQAAERVAERMDRAIVRAMEDGSYSVDTEALNRLLTSARRTLSNGNRQIRMVLEDHVPTVADLSMNHQAAAIVAMQGAAPNALSDLRVIDAFSYFERAIADKSIVRSSAPYVERWAAQWNDEWTKVARKVQAEFTRGLATGANNRDIAKGLVSDLGRLEINGKINNEDFAREFIRTSSGEMYQSFGLQIASEAGLDLFVNIGVPDDRQSEECYQACQEGAHTMEWWLASPEGPPKRHVFNCRCFLQAVTETAAEQDWTQPNEKFAKEAVPA